MTKEIKNFRKILAKGLPDAGKGNEIPVEFMESILDLYNAYNKIQANTVVLTKRGKPIKYICKQQADDYTNTRLGFAYYHINFFTTDDNGK